MKKINNKGFALVETLIVSAFVVGIFSVMFANFYPMMGEYEKRENSDDINSIYNAYLIKRLIENSGKETGYYYFIYGQYSNEIYIKIDKNLFTENSVQDYYDILVKNLNIDQIYLIRGYNLKELKENYLNDFDIQTREYIEYLPNYEQNEYSLECRIIVKYKADANKESDKKSNEFKFATIGVDCR